jgi:hypothetical protein
MTGALDSLAGAGSLIALPVQRRQAEGGRRHIAFRVPDRADADGSVVSSGGQFIKGCSAP